MSYSFQELITHTHESFTRIAYRNGRKSRNVEDEAFDQDVHALVLRTLVAHDLLNDGMALESSSRYCCEPSFQHRNDYALRWPRKVEKKLMQS